jgi:thiamine monophosphate synthase
MPAARRPDSPILWASARSPRLLASCPLVAIGGINATRAAEGRATGAHGVAVIGSIWRDPDPLQAAKELVTAVR